MGGNINGDKRAGPSDACTAMNNYSLIHLKLPGHLTSVTVHSLQPRRNDLKVLQYSVVWPRRELKVLEHPTFLRMSADILFPHLKYPYNDT
ncbi:hypothetical protein PsorP6_000881 [Peronosclerospora sorghi]|uniref:Uncharacterized protein n=1 Tax=Peronosclerospora sorghi TaxID=230839 RepID=A0ACC0WRB8_9STRA|nr:hypothetical protein PsorP6_000881 [Peronosclerospora sorghi]